MEQIDFKKITLEETGIYNKDYAFVSVFEKNNITRLSQVFNNAIMSRIIMECAPVAKNQLIGFISLLKYKFLKLPMAADNILEQKYENKLTDLYLLGFNFHDIVVLKAILSNPNINSEINPKTFVNYRFIDIIKAYLLYADERKSLIIKLVIEAFENKQEPSNFQDPETLMMLRNQLGDIKNMRELLDMLSINIQQQIEQISDTQNKDASRK